jgi:hypothetical protein
MNERKGLGGIMMIELSSGSLHGLLSKWVLIYQGDERREDKSYSTEALRFSCKFCSIEDMKPLRKEVVHTTSQFIRTAAVSYGSSDGGRALMCVRAPNQVAYITLCVTDQRELLPHVVAVHPL